MHNRSRTVARHCSGTTTFTDEVLYSTAAGFVSKAGNHRSKAPRNTSVPSAYLSGQEEHRHLRLFGESDCDSAPDSDATAAESSGGSETERSCAIRQSPTDLATAPFIHVPSGALDTEPTTSTDTWPTVPCQWSDGAPYPFRPPSPADQAAAFGVASQRFGEEPRVVMQHPFPAFNTPIASTAVDECAEPTYVSPRGYAHPPSRRPRDTHLEDLYHPVLHFFPQTDGKWVLKQVRRQLAAIREAGRTPVAADHVWVVASSQLPDEILRWVSVHRRDINETLSRAVSTADGGTPAPWKLQSAPWLIHERHKQDWACHHVWELRFYWQWKSAGTGRGQIVPLRSRLCTPEAKCTCCFCPRRTPHWDVAWFKAAVNASQCPDMLQASMIYGDGTRMTFAGTMSTVLKPHAKGFFDDVKAAIALAEAEVSESYINGPHAGHPFEPSISHSCNLVITIRNGKLKQRGVGDLTGRGDLEEYSTNAGREIDDLSLEYVTSADFCRALFVISLIGIALEIRKFDWRNFYRQCLRHPAEWWLQVCMRLGTGLFVDERKIMGDSTCCFTGNAVETILVWLIRWLLMTEVWGFDAVLMRQPQRWFAAVLAQPWAQDRRVRDWMLHRRRIFGEPRPDQSRADQMHALWNLLPAILAGYFDDTMTGGIPGLVEQITTAVFFLIIHLRIDAQFMKFERGTAEGKHYLYSGTELHMDPAKRSWAESPDQHHIMILGKEAVLHTFTRRDSAARLKYVAGLWTGCKTIVHQSVSRRIEQRIMQKIVGLLIFVTDTAAVLRALLNHTCRCLKTKNGFMAGRRGRSRSAMILECAAKGVEVPASVYKWSATPGTFTVCSRAAEAELDELLRVLPAVNGEHFFPRRSNVGGNGVTFIMNDSAGFEKRRDGTWPPPPSHMLAGAAWLLSPNWSVIAWMQERWDIEILKVTHSTQQELANGNANLSATIDRAPRGSDIVEIYDNEATVHMARRLATRKPGLVPLLQERLRLIRRAEQRQIRILTLWNDRTEGTPADLISKGQCRAAEQWIQYSAPHLTLAARPLARAPNQLVKLYQDGDL